MDSLFGYGAELTGAYNYCADLGGAAGSAFYDAGLHTLDAGKYTTLAALDGLCQEETRDNFVIFAKHLWGLIPYNFEGQGAMCSVLKTAMFLAKNVLLVTTPQTKFGIDPKAGFPKEAIVFTAAEVGLELACDKSHYFNPMSKEASFYNAAAATAATVASVVPMNAARYSFAMNGAFFNGLLKPELPQLSAAYFDAENKKNVYYNNKPIKFDDNAFMADMIALLRKGDAAAFVSMIEAFQVEHPRKPVVFSTPVGDMDALFVALQHENNPRNDVVGMLMATGCSPESTYNGQTPLSLAQALVNKYPQNIEYRQILVSLTGMAEFHKNMALTKNGINGPEKACNSETTICPGESEGSQ